MHSGREREKMKFFLGLLMPLRQQDDNKNRINYVDESIIRITTQRTQTTIQIKLVKKIQKMMKTAQRPQTTNTIK